jgi:ribosomal protein S27E
MAEPRQPGSKPKTWRQRDPFGREGTWTMAKCHECGKQTPVLVGAAGRPECKGCGVDWGKKLRERGEAGK